MPTDQDSLYTLLAPGVDAQGCELLGIQLSRGRTRTVLRLFIDSDKGITLDDCERVSHQVSGLLEVEDPIKGEYHLEVSSPGEDRPLFRREHYERFRGHPVRVRMAVAVDGRRNFTGELIGVSDDGMVRVRDEHGECALPLAQIAMARLLPQE